jgi:cold shock CspA family protein
MTASVFISYAREDWPFVEKLRADLQREGVKTWVDRFNLIPGQPWEKAIVKAIGECDYFIAVLSVRSVSKRGFVQREIREALEVADTYPEGHIFVIPVRIDDCEPSFDGLKKLHRADLFPDYKTGVSDLLRVFKYESQEKPSLVELEMPPGCGTIQILTDRGFGWIKLPSTKSAIFFHHKELSGVVYDELHVGDVVMFEVCTGENGPAAVNVTRA